MKKLFFLAAAVIFIGAYMNFSNTRVDKLGIVAERLKDCASLEDSANKATFAKEGLSERIDYIFVSKTFRVKKYDVLKSGASDHYPVVSTLEFIN